jgi:hypothetical protein
VARLREVPAEGRISLLDLTAELAPHTHRDGPEIEATVGGLVRDGLVERVGDAIRLAR